MGMWPNEQLYKKYQGSASLDSKIARGETNNVEGNSRIIPYKGKVKRIVDDINDGLRSCMSYVGANNIRELQKNATFIRVSQAGQIEAKPHGLI
jgi:IMP dehydrogenase/GMP reductase